MKMYFLGIDNGGTVTKAAIVDSEGREIALASRKVPMILPQPGFTERDMVLLWQANCEVIREVIAQAGIGAGEIRGIACTGHGKGLYLWGRDGKPAYNGIISTDSRAWSYPEGWEKDGTAARVHEKTYQKILACQPVSILRWFKDNRPEVLKKHAMDFRGQGLCAVHAHRGGLRRDHRLFRIEPHEPAGRLL